MSSLRLALKLSMSEAPASALQSKSSKPNNDFDEFTDLNKVDKVHYISTKENYPLAVTITSSAIVSLYAQRKKLLLMMDMHVIKKLVS